MTLMQALQTELAKLNDEQFEAVNTLDGTVLVVAGPGTGKTQLLSLRVANILAQRNVTPANILCLTFTNAGVEAMQKRLTDFIGREAYAVDIATFHSFGSNIRSKYPEFFEHGLFSKQIGDLPKKRLVESYLKNLHVSDPLYQKPHEGNYGKLNAVVGLIGNFKRAGLTVAQLRAILEQNKACFEYIEQQAELLPALDFKLTGKDKFDLIDKVAALVESLSNGAPKELKQGVVGTAGVYTPYISYLQQQFSSTELYGTNEETGKQTTTGFSELRKALFTKNSSGSGYALKDEAVNEELFSVAKIYEQYSCELEQKALFDYDDMILDTAIAIETHPKLKQILQEQYHYILVDEFQDTNGSQMRLVDLLSGYADDPNAEANLLVVGDDDQSIMRFQGASVDFINQFESTYKGTKRIVLKTNYRSTPSVVALGQTVAKQIERRLEASAVEKLLKAHKAEEQPKRFVVQKYANKELQYYEVARSIRAKIDSDYLSNASKPDEAIAVIAKKHKSLRDLIPYLNAQDVPFNYVVSTAVAQIPSLQTLFAMLEFAVAFASGRTSSADAKLPQILAACEFGFAPNDYFEFALNIKRAKHPRPSWIDSLQQSRDPRKTKLAALLLEAAQASIGAPARQIISMLAQPLLAYYKNVQADGAQPSSAQPGSAQPGSAQPSGQFAAIEFNYGLKELLRFAQAEHDSARRLGSLDHPLRLAELLDTLKDTERFNVELSINVPLDRSEAITLMTAHKSKGLEYDLVYLIDSDDKTWKSGGKDSVRLSHNMLIKTDGDDDDARRALFVAITRARYDLELSYAAGNIVAELLDEVQEVEPDVDAANIEIAANVAWQDLYYPKAPELLACLLDGINTIKLSASSLNKFVRYDKDGSDSSSYVLDNLVGLPSETSIALDFGNVMHGFFENYIKLEAARDDDEAQKLIQACVREIEYLDYDSAEIANARQRFELIVEHFLPVFKRELLTSSARLQSEQWVNCEMDGVPLTGKCDLLAFSEEDATIKVLDFKTGYPKDKPDAIFKRDYDRQLQFYKLLIENCQELQGWQVSGEADVYVEPQKPNWELVRPEYQNPSVLELERLRTLIKAVWWRIQNGKFDVCAFETSAQFEQAHANTDVYKTGPKAGTPKPPTKLDLQIAFEDWLIVSSQ